MKRILSLFLVSILSFFIFSYIDEYENLIVPLLKSNANSGDSFLKEGIDKEKLRKFLMEFNLSLSEVYISPDRSKISGLPVSSRIKKELADEISYLKRIDRNMETFIKDLEIMKVERLSSLSLLVKVKENSRVRYRSIINDNLSSFSDKEYGVNYLLESGKGGYIISSFEVLPLEELKGVEEGV